MLLFLKKIAKVFYAARHRILNKVEYAWLLFYSSITYRRKLHVVRKKERITVAFFMLRIAAWKYHSLYSKMCESQLFDPIVIVCPWMHPKEDTVDEEYEKAINYCRQNDYKFLTTATDKDALIEVKSKVKPDIVFFSIPYDITHNKCKIFNYLDTLTCYVPYSIRQENKIFNTKYDTLFQNVVWRNYYESFFHLYYAKKYARNKGKNVVITGYPSYEDMCNITVNSDAYWKKQDVIKKKIVWAPHWTIPGQHKFLGLDWSSFMLYSNFMFELAEEFKDLVQFSFKPHPNLKRILKDKVWGEEKTNNYYKKWERLQNGQLDEGDYAKLLATSDALIHDSGSFMIEYLMLNKPVLYTMNTEHVLDRFNEFGKLAFECSYKAKNKEQIREFVRQVIAGNQDTLFDKRKEFIENYYYINTRSATDNILNNLTMEIYGKPYDELS